MACTFSYDPSSTDPIHLVRKEIGDTKDPTTHPGEGIRPSGDVFCDEEISYYLSQNDNSVIGAALSLLTIVATEMATQPSEVTFGPFQESYKETMVALRRQIAMLERRYEEDKRKRSTVTKYGTVVTGISFGQ